MTIVYYSLTADADGTHERQWARSVTTLRRHNADVPVVLCLWGPARRATVETAARCDVRIAQLGPYAGAFAELPMHWRSALAAFPTMHKLPSLQHMHDSSPADRYVYLDCDTYLYGDVVTLAELHPVDWVAREEPCTRRSPFGYDPAYLDEDAFSGLAAAEGVVAVAPYNTGVFVLSHQAARTLLAVLEDFFWYAWRLLLGAALQRPHLFGDVATVRAIVDSAAPREHALALPYPSTNLWIVEQIATWLALGRVPGLSHTAFSTRQVVQSNEFLTEPPGYLAAHYFSSLADHFDAHLATSGAELR